MDSVKPIKPTRQLAFPSADLVITGFPAEPKWVSWLLDGLLFSLFSPFLSFRLECPLADF